MTSIPPGKSWSLIYDTEIPLADGGSLTTGPSADNPVGFEISRLPKPQWRIRAFDGLSVYKHALFTYQNSFSCSNYRLFDGARRHARAAFKSTDSIVLASALWRDYASFWEP